MAGDARLAPEFVPKGVPLKVFLCHMTPDLSLEKVLLLALISRIDRDGHPITITEGSLHAGMDDSVTKILACDLVLLVVGTRYGELIAERKLSLAEAQCRAAEKLGRPCLAYVRNPDSLPLKRYTEDHSTERTLLEHLRNHLQLRHQARVFAHPEELAAQLAGDLLQVGRAVELSFGLGGAARAALISAAVKDMKSCWKTVGDASLADGDKALARLESSNDIVLNALGEFVDGSLGRPSGHSKRVTAFAIAIARQMDLPRDRVRNIARGAYLMDIVRFSIRESLRGTAQPTPEERELLQQSPTRAYEMLRRIPFLAEAAEVAYACEERYDGRGYPRALVGELIPLGARIVAIAYSFEAMISDRPCRNAMSIPSARRTIERDAGKHFDPVIVKRFLGIPDSLWHELIAEIDRRL